MGSCFGGVKRTEFCPILLRASPMAFLVHAFMVVLDVFSWLCVAFLVEVLQLHERLPLINQALQSRGILPGAVPGARGIAHSVSWVCDPLLRLQGDVAHLQDRMGAKVQSLGAWLSKEWDLRVCKWCDVLMSMLEDARAARGCSSKGTRAFTLLDRKEPWKCESCRTWRCMHGWTSLSQE